MKVLWITERFPPDRGGVAISAGRQVDSLADRLGRLDVMRLDDALPPARVVSEVRGRVTLHRVGRAASSEESLQLAIETARNLWNAHGYDLIHGFYAVPAGYVATIAARLVGAPVVVSLRGNDVDRGLAAGARLPMLHWTLAHADRLLGVSREILRRASILADREAGLRHVPNGVDTDVFRPEGESDDSPFGGAPRPYIAFLGELRLKKGLPILMDLALRLARRDTGTLVWIGGVRAEERPGVENWRRAFGDAARRVRELPYQRDSVRLAAMLRAMDLFVYPSLWDGLPNALLEAMACARPIVASAAGGIPDVLEDGVSGRLVPLSRLDLFAEIVFDLLDSDPAVRERLGSAARERVLAAHTLQHECDAILDVYREVVK